MKVPSLIFLVFTILGIILGDVISNHIKSLIVMMCIYVVTLLFDDDKNIFLYFIAVIFGLYASFLTINIKNDVSFLKYRGKNVKIVANVVSDVIKKKDLYCYEIQTNKIRFRGRTKKINKNLLLKTDKELLDVFGKEIYLTGEIKIPKEDRNFGGFNYKRYLDSKKIKGTIFCKGNVIKIGKSAKVNKLLKLGVVLRKSIVKTIDSLLDKKEASLLKCILIGDTSCLEDDLSVEFRDLGLAHMLSVSGANIVYMLLIIKFVLKRLKVKYKLINPVLIIMLAIYTLIVGFTPSIVRAVVMAVLALAGELLFYNSRPLSNLCIAAIVVLLMNPFLLYSIGFQFSFIATLFIILFTDKLTKILEKLGLGSIDGLATSIVVYLGILPLEVYHFNKISVCSILVNIIVSPLHSLIIFLGMILIMLGSISRILVKPVAILLELIIKFLFILKDIFGKLSYLNINAVYVGITGVAIYYIILGCLYFYKKHDRARIFFQKYRNLFIIGTTAIIIVSFIYPKKFVVNFMDVGQGDCAIIQTIHNKNILIDTGDGITLSDIIRNNVNKIDTIIVTHGHQDHMGKLLDILDNIKVDKLIVPDTKYIGDLDKIKINKNKTKLYRCKNKDSILVDKYTKIEFLNPSKSSKLKGENDNSLVLRLRHKDINFLFTGDISDNCEKDMIENNVDLSADILKVAHHGSPYSTSEEFLNKVNPRLAVISVGENNKFNHPSSEVLDRLYKKNVRVLRTDENGQVQIIIDGEKVKMRKRFL